MPGLWRKSSTDAPEGKYLVQRRDGTVPEWPWFVLGARDPAAFWALLEYANAAKILGYDEQYVQDIFSLASEFDMYLKSMGPGDPDAPKHRVDDPETIAKMAKGEGA